MRFSALRHLDLSRNRLTHLPETLRYCSQLTWLDLTANFALATLATQSGPYAQASDNVLAALVRLRHLGLGECDLTAIPASFGLLVSLTQLSAFGNRLSLIPPELGRLKRLTRLDLSANRLCEVPPELGQLRALEWLHLGENQIVYLPDEFANLISLQELGLGDNQLVSLPDLSPLCHLTSLILHTNRLTVLPPTICHLASLTRLDLAHNRLVALPPALWTLPCLETLYLQGNSTLTRLPARFHYLPAGPASQSTQSFQAASSAAAGGRHPFSVALPGGTRIPSSSMHRPLPRPPALVMTRLDVAATGLQALPWPLAAVQWRTLRLFEPSNLTRPASDLRSALVTIPTPTGGGGSIPQQQQQRAAVELLATERPRAPPRLTTLALNAVLMAHPIFHAAAAATTAPRPSPADTPSTSGHRRTHHHSLATPGRSGGDAGQKSDRDGSSARSTQFLTPTTSTTTGAWQQHHWQYGYWRRRH
ncbi:hypothetical protein BC828DRAFT_169567 [Blastocladiella britannica]|nr:hypothetical protein BC828DRAFT_169567 [Blastocladiella britannica]